MTLKPFPTVLSLAACLLSTFVWCQRGLAQQQSQNSPAMSPLVSLLLSKGVLTEEEAAHISQGSSPVDVDKRPAPPLISTAATSQSHYHPASAPAAPST